MLSVVETILVAYGEIALKSRFVRNRLESLLSKQIGFILNRLGFDRHRVLRRYGRFYIEDVPLSAAEDVAKIFGVVSAMPSLKTASDFDSVLKLAVKVALERISDGQTFAVRPRTVGCHSYTSRDLAVDIGSLILEAFVERNVHVNLDEPDVTIYIEIRDKEAFLYTHIFKGVRGLPYGSQGRLVSLFSGGIDSPVSTWMMMKRGAEILPLFMDQRPYVGENYVIRVDQAFQKVYGYVPSMDYGLYVAPFGDIMTKIMEATTPSLRCVLCKRSMYRVAMTFATEMQALGIVTGESLGQVASQTLDNLFVIDGVAPIPVLRPLIGFDKVEIEEVARKIGTYKITARTVNGCTVLPERPTTRAQIEQIIKMEKELNLEEICLDISHRIEKRTLPIN